MLTVLRHGDGPRFSSIAEAATGRSLLAHMLVRWKPSAVLMPAYVPEGVILPFKAAGIPIRFYKLHRDLRPDHDTVRALICRGALLIVIHYFGKRTATQELRTICDKAGAALLEDCAHCVPPLTLAPDADLILFSYNKVIPVTDGAVLKSRHPEIDVALDYEPPLMLPGPALEAYDRHLRANEEAEWEESAAAYEDYYAAMMADGMRLRAISARSKDAIRSWDWGHQRPPTAFVLRVSAAERDDYAQDLMKYGIKAAVCQDKWDHVPAGEEAAFQEEKAFMAEHLLLPPTELLPLPTEALVGGAAAAA